jgi:hypothetical protein
MRKEGCVPHAYPKQNARNAKGIPGHKGYTTEPTADLLPSRLSLSALASHQICLPPLFHGRDRLAGSTHCIQWIIPPVGNFTLPRSLSNLCKKYSTNMEVLSIPVAVLYALIPACIDHVRSASGASVRIIRSRIPLTISQSFWYCPVDTERSIYAIQ